MDHDTPPTQSVEVAPLLVSHHAASRVDYRLSYEPTEEPRECHQWGISGPDLRNAYFGRVGHEASSETGSGDWDDPEHPIGPDVTEEEHVEAWFASAVREAIHEALEWFWVDEAIYLDPHGRHMKRVHNLSSEFANRLLELRRTEVDRG